MPITLYLFGLKLDEHNAIWTAVSSLATAFALIWTLVVSYKNRRKIDNLARLTEEIAEQNKLLVEQNLTMQHQLSVQRQVARDAIRPTLIPNTINPNYNDSCVSPEISNTGPLAIITKLTISPVHVMHHNLLPLHVEKNKFFSVSFDLTLANRKSTKWQLVVDYTDVNGNPYQLTLHGVDGKTVTYNHKDLTH